MHPGPAGLRMAQGRTMCSNGKTGLGLQTRGFPSISHNSKQTLTIRTDLLPISVQYFVVIALSEYVIHSQYRARGAPDAGGPS
jgi:hypothetical protein